MEPDVSELRSRLLPPNGTFARVDVVASTSSTNADLAVAARSGAEHGTLLLAREQTAGRGRRSRSWVSTPGTGLYGSVLLRPTGIPAAQAGWTTLLGGLAVAQVAEDAAGVPAATLKWPNDVLVAGGKLAGVLAEAVPGVESGELAVVLGIGVNVLRPPARVEPGPGDLLPTSLEENGATLTDLTVLACELYGRVEALYGRWQHAGGDIHSSGLLAEYRARCGTLGAAVRVELGEESITGTALDVDDEGKLVVELAGGGTREVAAGDVVHLRGARAR